MGRTVVVKVLSGQLVITLVSAVVCAVFFAPMTAGAALAGGGINIAAALVFALRLFAPGPRAEPKKLVRALYAGAAIKFLVTAGLFALAIPVFADQIGALLGTFIATLVVYWLALLWVDDDQ